MPRHITQACAFQAAGQPVISVDTRKKELIGPFKNGGSDYRPKGSPEAVNVHDFSARLASNMKCLFLRVA